MISTTYLPVPIPRGWQCPVCKRVYAPSWPMCSYCGNQPVTYTNRMDTAGKPIKESSP